MDAAKLLDDEPGLQPARAMEIDDELNAPSHDAIAHLAYSYWEARGSQGGSAVEDWLRAEEELSRRNEI